MANQQRDYEAMSTSWLKETAQRANPAQKEQMEQELERRRQEARDGR